MQKESKEIKEKKGEIEKRKERFSEWFKKPEHVILLIIILFSLSVNFYYFFITMNQPLWWDEAVYFVKAKELGLGVEHTPKIFHSGRAILDTFIYAGFYKIGLGEVFFRILKIFITLTSLILIYVIGKELFNKWVGLFAAFAFSMNWVNLFVTTRFFPDSTGLLTWLLTIFFFYKGYVSEKANPKYLWLVGPLFVLSIYAREFNLFFLPMIFIYLIFTKKLSFLKDKNIWITIGLLFLMIIPFMLFYYSNFGDPFANITRRLAHIGEASAEETLAEGVPYGHFVQFQYMSDYLGWIIILLLLIGLSIFVELFLGFDLFLKGHEKKMNKLFFLFTWLIVPLFLTMMLWQVYDERYVFFLYPAFFYLAGNGLFIIYNNIKRYNKIIAVLVVISILLMVPFFSFVKSWGGGGYMSHLTRADNLIKGKLNSYWQVKEAGLWIKQNSVKTDIMYGGNSPQLVYYAERKVFGFPATEQEFLDIIKKEKPKYMFIAAYDGVGAWVYEFSSKHQDIVQPVIAIPMVKGTQSQQGNIGAIIYQFKYQ